MAFTFATSAAVPVPHRFSKQQLFEELAWFMPALVHSFVRLCGAMPPCWGAESTIGEPGLQALRASPMWRSLGELYDYGVHGVLPTINDLGDGSLLDVELFLDGIDGLREYLREDDGEIPKLSKATVALARARQNLDEADVNDQVATAQIALLARLPEGRVCDQLGVAPGTRMSAREAQEKLTQTLGFVATGSSDVPMFSFVQCVSMELPIDVVRAINDRAGHTGVAPLQVLREAFRDEIGRDENPGAHAIPETKDRR